MVLWPIRARVLFELFYKTNSYNFAMNPISQDDHLTSGAWTVCQFMYSKQNEIALSFIPTSKLQKKRTSYFNLSIDVWNLFLFVPVHLNASKGKGSLTHLTFKEYLKIYFESLRLNLAQIKKKSKLIIFEGLIHHLKEEALDRRKRN